MGKESQRHTVGGIQALRAIACTLVIFQHATFFACTAKEIDYHEYLRVNFGWTGVGIFFVISGYVMHECFAERGHFILNRAARVYPPFWMAIGLSFLLLGGAGTEWSIDARSLVLLPSLKLNESYQIPYWTLCYEVAFYCLTYLMTLLRLSRKGVVVACLVWLMAIWSFDTYFTVLNSHFAKGWFAIVEPGWWILASPMSIYFIIGLLVSAVGLHAIRRVPTTVLFVGFTFIWWLGSANTMSTYAHTAVILSVSYAMLLIGMTRLSVPEIAKRLGDFSYGAYLFHFMAIVATQHALAPVVSQLKLSTVWMAMLAAGVGGGLLYGWIEYKIHTRVVKPILRVTLRGCRGIKAISK